MLDRIRAAFSLTLSSCGSFSPLRRLLVLCAGNDLVLLQLICCSHFIPLILFQRRRLSGTVCVCVIIWWLY